MKPRLEALQITDEDFDIWLSLRDRWPKPRLLWYALADKSIEQDRRDAELMLWREGFRQQCANLRAPQMTPRLWLLCMANPTSTPQELL